MKDDLQVKMVASVARTSVVASKTTKRAGVCRAALLTVAIATISLGVVGNAAAESPPGCSDATISVSVTPSPSGVRHHGDNICYGVCYGATGSASPCDIRNLVANLILPNNVSRPVLAAPGVSILAGQFFCCPSADPRCNPALTAADYCYTVAHADEILSFNGCPPLKTAGIGRLVAHTEGSGESRTPAGDEVAPCATANNEVRHACCEPCSGTCTEVRSDPLCPAPRTFTPDKHCSEVTCTPRVCPGPIPPCEGGQVCSTQTGQCVNQPDAPLSTPCTGCTGGQTQCNDCHCNGQGLCTNNPDPLSTPCEVEIPPNQCTIDHCTGTGTCVRLRTVCDDNPGFCNDNNVCTLDVCNSNLPPSCCEHRPIPCPNRPCFRVTGCDPIDGCQYAPDCTNKPVIPTTAGDQNLSICCPDEDENSCTTETCDKKSGLCRSTPDCLTAADCNDGLNCTVDSCLNSCCVHEPLCAGENECFKEAPCSAAQVCTRPDGCEGACFFTAAGNTRCFAGEFSCDHPACQTDADCATGEACSDTCCGLQCLPLCTVGSNGAAVWAPNQATGSSNGEATGDTTGGIVVQPICCADGASCDDRNACTDDLCIDGCCEYRPHVCPPCHRCDPILGCVPDCRTGENCCPDDQNPCTAEFCDIETGICRSRPQCTTDTQCNDGINCTKDSCENSCCVHRPLCVKSEGECFKEAPCSEAEACTRPGDGCQGACFFTAAGTTKCFAGEFFCDQAECSSDADCPSGSACSDTCCGLQCVPLCGNPFPATAAANEGSGGSSSGENTADGGVADDALCCADGASCNDFNACTDDICFQGCCEYRPHVCPPCHRCDPVFGCIPDCRTGPNCCPDDENPCTHEFCEQESGVCRFTPDCRTAADCDDGLNCTADSCEDFCCYHRPLCTKVPDCPCGTSCTDPLGNRGICADLTGDGVCECTFNPDPECAGQTCATFTTCNAGSPDCGNSGVCGSTAEGGGLCVDGSTPCAGLTDCVTSADCPGGLCFVNTCCGRPVCAPDSIRCQPGPAVASVAQENGICCADGVSCDDQNACTDEACIEGCCEYRPHVCPERSCYISVGCHPTDGCLYEPVACEPGCTFDPEEPDCCKCGCGEDIGCKDGPICRPAENKCDIAECCNEKQNEGVPACPFDVTYDLNGDGFVDKFDFSLFSDCWLLCPLHKDYAERCCDKANFSHCGGVPLPYPSGTWCVGKEDFAYFMTAMNKSCDDPFIKTPEPCCDVPNTAAPTAWPPMPTDAELIEAGLRVPPADWIGFQTGAVPVQPEQPVPVPVTTETNTLGGRPDPAGQGGQERTAKDKETIRQRTPR